MSIYTTCDKCGTEQKEQQGKKPEERFCCLNLGMAWPRQQSKIFHLCPTCLDKLGFVIPAEPNAADQLLNTLYGIIEEVVEERLNK